MYERSRYWYLLPIGCGVISELLHAEGVRGMELLSKVQTLILACPFEYHFLTEKVKPFVITSTGNVVPHSHTYSRILHLQPEKV